jgi:hypothetical protein
MMGRPRNPNVRSRHLNAENLLEKKIEKLERAASQPTAIDEFEKSWPEYEAAERRRKAKEAIFARLHPNRIVVNQNLLHDNLGLDELVRLLDPPKPNTVKLEVQG